MLLNVRRLISLSFSNSTALLATVDALIDDVLRSIRFVVAFVRLVAIDDAPSASTVAGVLETLRANVDKRSDRAAGTELAMLLGRVDRLAAVVLLVATLDSARLDSVTRSESTLDTLAGRLPK